MSRFEKLIFQLLRGISDANFAFEDLRSILLHLEFEERTRGSHHIFRRAGVEERITLQRDGEDAKPRQVRTAILRHKLGGEG